MNRKVYCSCDSDFTSHYTNQAGRGFSDIEVFRGHPYQRGYGFGSVLKRYGIPILKMLGKHLLRTGIGVGEDLLKNASFKQSIKNRGREGLKAATKQGLEHVGTLIDQAGSGLKRKRKNLHKKSRKKRIAKDIFS